MRLRTVLHVTGTLVRLFSPALLTPALVAVWYRESHDAIGFFVTFVATAVVGTVMRRVGQSPGAGRERLRRVEGLAIVAMTSALSDGEYFSGGR